MIDQGKCKNCLHKKRINAQNDWWFNACYHAPHKGKLTDISKGMLKGVLLSLNRAREEYINTKDKNMWY